MTVFFTSDTHFGHRRIIEHCWRPFQSVEEMDATLIERWNARVGKNDTVYHLGDFTLGAANEASLYRSQLNGKIHLIWGNHDRTSVRGSTMDSYHRLWHTSQPYAEISVDGQKIMLCHYAMRTWNKIYRGAIMLYGHSHGNLPGTKKSIDVGVDSHDFQPVTLRELQEKMAALPDYEFIDHHRPDDE